MIIIFGYKSHEILVPQPGIKPVPCEVEVRSLIHWTREVSQYYFLMIMSTPLEILYIISLQISPQNYWFLKKMQITSEQKPKLFIQLFLYVPICLNFGLPHTDV